MDIRGANWINVRKTFEKIEKINLHEDVTFKNLLKDQLRL